MNDLPYIKYDKYWLLQNWLINQCSDLFMKIYIAFKYMYSGVQFLYFVVNSDSTIFYVLQFLVIHQLNQENLSYSECVFENGSIERLNF